MGPLVPRVLTAAVPLLLGVSSPVGESAAPAPSDLLAVREKLVARIEKGEVPSLAVGVVRGGKVLWEEGLGWADREAGARATAETLYPVASVSKSLTATGALALVARGQLRTDQPVAPFLPGPLASLGGSVQAVNVEHLLAHTSGIPHLSHYAYPDRKETVVGREELLRRHAFVASPPGERYLYTNLGYGVLAQVVERAGGAPFQDVMARELFRPLGMANTTLDAWVGEGGVARGYDGDGGWIPYPYRLGPDGGAGFFSSLHDLLRYALFHLGRLDAGVPRSAAVTTALPLPGGGFRYLQGWGLIDLPGATVLLSDGQMAGGASVVLLVPEADLGIVVLTNQTGGAAYDAAFAILSGLLPGAGERLGARIEEIERDLARPGVAPSGRYEGWIGQGDVRTAVQLDVPAEGPPTLAFGEGPRHLLQAIAWERGAWTATVHGSLGFGAGKERTHRLQLTLWWREGVLQGVAEELLSEDRPRFGVPHFVELRAQ
jgi:CubicO group peptidase (beta-lactamase class C family)